VIARASSPRRAKSAERIDGAIRVAWRTRFRNKETKALQAVRSRSAGARAGLSDQNDEDLLPAVQVNTLFRNPEWGSH
jgi:hypothetical protein